MSFTSIPLLRLELFAESDRKLLAEFVEQGGPGLRPSLDGPLVHLHIIVAGAPYLVVLLSVPDRISRALDGVYSINQAAERAITGLREQAVGKSGGFLAAHSNGPLIAFGWKTGSGETRTATFLITTVDSESTP